MHATKQSLQPTARNEQKAGIARPGPVAGLNAVELQRTIGNTAMRNLLHAGKRQAAANHVPSNRPNDPGEMRADNAARRLDAQNLINGNHSPETGNQALAREHKLPDRLRTSLESRLGADFGDVRIHTGSEASQSAARLRARAYTVGTDIVFGNDQFAPGTLPGAQLLAHELSHVADYKHAPPATPMIHRQAEPPLPKDITPVKQDFATLPDKTKVSDPTGRTHGIQIQRSGDELFYFLPNDPAPRKVPRPIDSKKPSQREPVNRVKWGGDRPLQTAFEVQFGMDALGLPDVFLTPYTVNIHGVARAQDIAGMLLRQAPALEVQPGGLESERDPGGAGQARPKAKRFQNAQRYHMPDAPFSMYVFPDRTVEVAEDGTGKRLWNLAGAHLVDFRVSPRGDVRITWNDPVGVATVTFSIRGPLFSPTGLGVLGTSAQRTTLLANLKALKVDIIERGSQFTDIELEAAHDVIKRWTQPTGVVDSLKANKTPGLKLVKDVVYREGGSFDDATGEVKIPGDVEMTPTQQRNVVIHEVTHALYQARGLKTPRGTAAMPAQVTSRATTLLGESKSCKISEGAIRSRAGTPRTQRQWEEALSTDDTLNVIWTSLHRRFNISDPEGTGDIRGMDVADESRYLGDPRGDVVGHGFDNTSEFVASFVASSLRFQAEMSATITRSNDRTLANLYRQLWDWVNTNLVSLGSKNPYDDVIAKIKASTSTTPSKKP